MTQAVAANPTLLVVGGGISGMTAALEAAECGQQVIKEAGLDGHIIQPKKLQAIAGR